MMITTLNSKIKIVKYFDNLDALRGIACLSVLFFHIPSFLAIDQKSEIFRYISIILSFNGQGGKLGVFFFFTLSGFLISYLLFSELATARKISIINFYIRRLLRIWPLYFLVLFIGFFLSGWISSGLKIDYHETANLFYYISFASNFDVIYNSLPVNKILGTVWSVAIEEQFYLIWPWLFFIFHPKKIIYAFVIFFLIALTFIIHNSSKSDIIYYHTISCSLYLSFGAIVAFVAFFYGNFLVSKLEKVSIYGNLLIYVVSIVILFLNNQILEIFYPWLWMSKVFSTIFFSYVIIEQIYSNTSVMKLGRFKILNFTGKLSYGLYILHMCSIYIVYYIAMQYKMHFLLQILLVLLISYLLSFVSYYYFEKPFITLKKKFAFKND